MSFWSDFKTFAIKGNAMDLAVGVIIGAAFGKIVTSLVEDVIMPPIGVLLGGVDFAHFAVTLTEHGADGKPVLLKYGAFLNAVIGFVLVAGCVFLLVKVMNGVRRKSETAPTLPPSAEVLLLGEIRDLLKTPKS